MNTQQAYNSWANQYDSNDNKTRDLEARALRECLGTLSFDRCLEIGCGTGKNTIWLAGKSQHITAVDLSEEMVAKAKEKVKGSQVQFKLADITKEWDFCDGSYDLAVFSLVLEHIEDLGPVLKKTSHALNPGGYVYIGELHPFKQYTGSKARFDTEEGQQVVQCFNHHISDFLQAAYEHGLQLFDFREYFDDDDRKGMPRVLAMVFRKGS
jgi:Methylase involved in ubiquinone/menaquinone biosynthesis